MKKLKVFVAGSSLTRDYAKHIMRCVEAAGHLNAHDWTATFDEDVASGFDPTPIAVKLKQEVKECDVLVRVWNGASSDGAPYEMGLAEGLKKTVIVMTPNTDSLWPLDRDKIYLHPTKTIWETPVYHVKGTHALIELLERLANEQSL